MQCSDELGARNSGPFLGPTHQSRTVSGGVESWGTSATQQIVHLPLAPLFVAGTSLVRTLLRPMASLIVLKARTGVGMALPLGTVGARKLAWHSLLFFPQSLFFF